VLEYRVKAVPIIFLLVLATGCELWDPRPDIRGFVWGVGDESVPDPNAEIRKKEYSIWPKEIRQAVDDRLVLVGMTKNQVLVAIHLGEKDIRKQFVDTERGKAETWTVWRVNGGWAFCKMPYSQMVTIFFREGAVVQIKFHAETKEAIKATPWTQ
jgi:hypothetical protein